MIRHDDALERIAHAMAGEDGCSHCFRDDGRCCMTDRAKDVLSVVLQEIDACGLEAGCYRGVLDVFARRVGVEFAVAQPQAGTN